MDDQAMRTAARDVAARMPELLPEEVKRLRFLLGVDSEYVPPLESERRQPSHGRVAGVYFIRAGGFINIGMSTDVQSRLRGLQTASPSPLELLAVVPGARAEEDALHQRFAHLRGIGEWFSVAPELLEFVAEVGRNG